MVYDGGLLGPNGAGKSTLMRIVATITRATEGTIHWNGIDIARQPNTLRTVLGYLTQDFGVYPHLSAQEFLEYMAALKGLDARAARQRIEELLQNLNLTNARKKPLGSYSGGMKQRVGIAQALLNDPQSGDAGHVKVEAKGIARGRDLGPTLDTSSFNAASSQKGDTITVNANVADSVVIDGGKDLDITITLPASSTVEASVSTDDIDVKDLRGAVVLTSDSGSITVKNVVGQMTLTSGTGAIKLEQIKLNGKSRILTTDGSIQFEGSLDPQGSTQVQTETSNITMTLPRNASFSLSASTSTGHVSNEFGSDTGGNAPRAKLQIRTEDGNITLKEEKQ